MKRHALLLSLLFAAAVYAAPWTLYKGSTIVKPRVAYASLDECTAGANAQPPGAYACTTSVPVMVAPAAVVWQDIAGESGAFRISAANSVVRYGAGSAWIEQTLQPGNYVCGQGLADPAFGTYKGCQLKQINPAFTWMKIADAGGVVTIAAPQMVRFGRYQTWSEMPWPAGKVYCNAGIFNAPGDGQCELRSGPSLVIPKPSSAMTDHSGMGPRIDLTKPMQPPDASTWQTTDRLVTLWLDPKTGLPTLYAGPSDLGAFRVPQGFAGFAADDPLVLPGQPGKSHMHAFFGTLPGATWSDACPGSFNQGGTLNCTTTWVPAIVDTRDGSLVKLAGNNLYYKRSYLIFDHPPTDVVPIPQGLAFVSGDAHNTDPNQSAGSFICLGPNGENPGWKRSFKAAFADGTCVPGADFIFSLNAPYCWDGVNLDSPNHKDHLTFPVQDGLGDPNLDRGFHCPATHPKQIPAIGLNIHHAIQPGDDVSAWQLSCDMGDKDSGGACAHMDYRMNGSPKPRPDLWGENRTLYEMWTQHCLVEKRDCKDSLLGDNLHMLN